MTRIIRLHHTHVNDDQGWLVIGQCVVSHVCWPSHGKIFWLHNRNRQKCCVVWIQRKTQVTISLITKGQLAQSKHLQPSAPSSISFSLFLKTLKETWFYTDCRWSTWNGFSVSWSFSIFVIVVLQVQLTINSPGHFIGYTNTILVQSSTAVQTHILFFMKPLLALFC